VRRHMYATQLAKHKAEDCSAYSEWYLCKCGGKHDISAIPALAFLSLDK